MLQIAAFQRSASGFEQWGIGKLAGAAYQHDGVRCRVTVVSADSVLECLH